MGILEREHTALVQIELILVGLARVQHLHVATLHAHAEPVAGGTVAEREDLRREVELIHLAAVAHVPYAHGVVEAAREDAHAVGRDVNAAGAVRVALELLDEQLIVNVPDGNVAVRAAAETDFRVGRDGQGVAGGRLWIQLTFLNVFIEIFYENFLI